MARYALIVGIETYNSQYLQDLSKSVIDAKDFAQILEDYGNCPRNHITLLSGQVTGDELIQALKTFLSEQAKNQDAIIYFSGHGILEKQQDPLTDEVSQKGYLAASDCQLSKKENQWVVKDNAIPLESITKLINHTELSSLIIILDACHGVALIQEINHSFNIFQNNTTYYFIAACQSYEDSWARKSKRHSEFTGALIEALSQDKADDDGIVTIGQAFEQASKRLETGRQEPTFMGKGSRLPLVKYSVTSLLKTVSKSAQIPDNDLEILQPYLEQIDRPILTWAMMEGVSAYALNHWLALDEALSIDSFLTVIREQFPQKPDGTSSFISVLHVLSCHPKIAPELRDYQRGKSFRVLYPPKNHDTIDPDTPDKKAKIYQAYKELIEGVNAAIYLRRPLLVTGRPGSGKTSLAYAIAYELQLGSVLAWSITTRTNLQNGLYNYDAIARLQNLQLLKLKQELGQAPPQQLEENIGQYLQLGAVGTAFLPSYHPRVLLIDEIDRDYPRDDSRASPV